MTPSTSPPEPLPGHARHRLKSGERFRIAGHPTADSGSYASEQEAAERLTELRERIKELSRRFAADGSRALLVVLQGFDGAGKDSVITHVLSAIDPSMLHVFDFNKPVGAEAAHDFLWRFHHQTPELGTVHVFDRSYYEEVISARVHGLVSVDVCRARYDSINDLERILSRDGTVLVKVFLHISPETQARRVEERLHRREMQAKFAASDVKDRDLWDEYDEAYEDAIGATTTDHAPWHVIPADHRWYAQTAVAETLVATLEALDPRYPPLDAEELEEAGIDPSELDEPVGSGPG